MRIPSVKTMTNRGFTEEQAQWLRAKMERYHRKYPFGQRPFHTMTAMSKYLNLEEIHEQPKGTNQKSPAFMYISTGDTYDTTILFYNGNFHIGDAGTLYEQGNYP